MNYLSIKLIMNEESQGVFGFNHHFYIYYMLVVNVEEITGCMSGIKTRLPFSCEG